jgi:hypothetical protein
MLAAMCFSVKIAAIHVKLHHIIRGKHQMTDHRPHGKGGRLATDGRIEIKKGQSLLGSGLF